MYCPKCSQQQVSDETRFCSRCGFQLDAVKALLTGNQESPAGIETEPQAEATSNRKRDLLLGATVMMLCAVAVALLTVSTVAGTPLQAVIIPLLLVWAAIASILLLSGHTVREVKRLFSRDADRSRPDDSTSLITKVSAASRGNALPPVQSLPASGPGTWRTKTAELVQPRSVTEQTTGLLDQKGE